jgi:hypothetical protein
MMTCLADHTNNLSHLRIANAIKKTISWKGSTQGDTKRRPPQLTNVIYVCWNLPWVHKLGIKHPLEILTFSVIKIGHLKFAP